MRAKKDMVSDLRMERKKFTKMSYLSVILGAGGEKRLKGVVTGDEETGKVDEELASDVEEDKEEVDSDKAEDDIDLGDIGLTLKVGEDRVLGELQNDRCQLKITAIDNILKWLSKDAIAVAPAVVAGA